MTKIASCGTVFQVNLNNGGYVTVAQVKTLKPPGTKTKMIDATALDSPSCVEESIPGNIDPGQVSLALLFDPALASQTTLRTAQLAGSLLACRVIWSNSAATTWTFNAYVEEFTPTANVGDLLAADATLKVTGVPTLP